MVEVAARAARMMIFGPTITATWRCTRSAASAGSRSNLFSAQRKGDVVAVDEAGFFQVVTECRYPANGIGSRGGIKETDHSRCARAVTGHAAAAPSVATNCRRWMWLAM